MYVTLVIPTLNRKEFLENTLRDIADQKYDSFEVLIVDQSDQQFEYILPSKISDRVKIIYLKEKSASLARNIGIKEGKGDIIIFLDDDIQIPNENFIYYHVHHYIGTNRSGVAGAILSPGQGLRSKRHKLSYWKRSGWLFFPMNYSEKCEIENGWAGNLSVRRKYALEIGGMDQQYVKGAFREESDFCSRLVNTFGPLIYDPEAYLIHYGASSGGLRDFKSNSKIRAQHHFDGMFYFLFNNVRLKDYPLHLLSFIMVFFKSKEIMQRPSMIFNLCWRTAKGVFNGLSMKKRGRKLISEG